VPVAWWAAIALFRATAWACRRSLSNRRPSGRIAPRSSVDSNSPALPRLGARFGAQTHGDCWGARLRSALERGLTREVPGTHSEAAAGRPVCNCREQAVGLYASLFDESSIEQLVFARGAASTSDRHLATVRARHSDTCWVDSVPSGPGMECCEVDRCHRRVHLRLARR
jgi:hypothetical protein